jgi:hypothetical protein
MSGRQGMSLLDFNSSNEPLIVPIAAGYMLQVERYAVHALSSTFRLPAQS